LWPRTLQNLEIAAKIAAHTGFKNFGITKLIEFHYPRGISFNKQTNNEKRGKTDLVEAGDGGYSGGGLGGGGGPRWRDGDR